MDNKNYDLSFLKLLTTKYTIKPSEVDDKEEIEEEKPKQKKKIKLK